MDCTCSGCQLQRGLRVVLHPVLQGALYVGFGIEQQLCKLGEDINQWRKRRELAQTEGSGEEEMVNGSVRI